MDRGCLLWTAAELAGLSDDVLGVVVADVKTRTFDEKHLRQNIGNAPVQPPTPA
jgi:hypothetical protein